MVSFLSQFMVIAKAVKHPKIAIAIILKVQVSDGNALDVLVLGQTVQATLLAVATLLDTTERSLSSADLARVGTNHSNLELLGHAHNSANVLGEEVTGKTELGVVGEAEDILLGVELEHRGQGTEGLVLGDLHFLGDTGQNCGLVEETGGLGRLAASLDLGALGDSVGNVLLNLLNGGLVDEGTLSGLAGETTSDFESSNLLDELGGELLGDTFLDVQSVGAGAVSILFTFYSSFHWGELTKRKSVRSIGTCRT